MNGFARIAWAATSAALARAAGLPMAAARGLLAMSERANRRARP